MNTTHPNRTPAMTINDAISRSENHNEIASIRVASQDEARSMIDDAKRIAEAAGLEFDYTDTNDGYDSWAYDSADNSDAMAWRVILVIAGK